MPAVVSGALLAFALSFDDYVVVTTFNAGVGSSTLPLFIYGKVKFGDTAGDQRDLDDHRGRDGRRRAHRVAHR